jgi:hypothetical protein
MNSWELVIASLYASHSLEEIEAGDKLNKELYNNICLLISSINHSKPLAFNDEKLTKLRSRLERDLSERQI